MKDRRTIKNGDPSGLPMSCGLTVIELIMALTIISILMTAVMILYSRSQTLFFNQSQKSDAIFDSRAPLNLIGRDIREALDVLSGPVVIDSQTYSTSNSCVILKLPSIDADGLIIDIDNVFDTVIYYRHQQYTDRLVRVVDADESSSRYEQSRVMIQSCDGFDLLFFDASGNTTTTAADIFQIRIALDSRYLGSNRDFFGSLTTDYNLRNKGIS
ncbi:MAG: prepilin-type N-terminal cleavage/methylation domain-containing protein [Candidatus Aminicenantes bacterium]|nr:prepilin-type N-terminal cleavage/methylation domain-containing protein [Candidatus Aminicenantes bacterium]